MDWQQAAALAIVAAAFLWLLRRTLSTRRGGGCGSCGSCGSPARHPSPSMLVQLDRPREPSEQPSPEPRAAGRSR
jgi:FeoB-associated Cys-rich membrane protein